MSPNVVLWILVVLGLLGGTGLAIYAAARGWNEWIAIGLVVGAFLVMGVVYAIYDSARKRRRREAAPQAAAELGLSPAGPGTSMPALPFELMSRGQGRTSENVMTGSMDGAVWVFDYTYHTTSYNANTNSSSRSDFYFSCAVGVLPTTDLPSVRISREGFFSRVARTIGIEDVEVGDERFDRRFKVKAADPAVARELLDPGLQQWLMGQTEEVNFEVQDGLVLAYTKQRDLSELRPVLDALVGFRQHLPRFLLERYSREAAER